MINREKNKSGTDEDAVLNGDIYETNPPNNFPANIFPVINIISFISLSLVVFGILILGAIVAPVVFQNLNPRSLASEIMSDIFLRYYPVAFTCLLITLCSEISRLILASNKLLKSRIWMIQFFIILTVTGLMGYSNYVLLPAINNLRINQKGPTLWTNQEFIVMHKRSEDFAMAIFILGMIPLCFLVTQKNES